LTVPVSDICKVTEIDFMAETECLVFSSAVFLCLVGSSGSDAGTLFWSENT